MAAALVQCSPAGQTGSRLPVGRRGPRPDTEKGAESQPRRVGCPVSHEKAAFRQVSARSHQEVGKVVKSEHCALPVHLFSSVVTSASFIFRVHV